MVQSMDWIECVGGGTHPHSFPTVIHIYTYVYNSGNFKQILTKVKSLKALIYKGLRGIRNKK